MREYMKTEILSNKDYVQYINGRLFFIKEKIDYEKRMDSENKESIYKQIEEIKKYLSIIFDKE